MSSKTDRLFVSLASLTVVAAVALRFYGLGSGLWYDEIVTLVESARMPLSRIVSDFPGVNTHPLYSVLAHLSLRLFGDSAWALRLPAALFGAGSVAMTYALASRMLGRLEGWAAALLLAVSYHHVWFSQNARGYTMMGFFALLSTHALLRARQSGERRFYIIFTLATVAGIYTHLTMAFVVAGQAAVVFAARVMPRTNGETVPVRPFLLSNVAAAILTAALYAPYVPGLVAHLGAAAPREAAQVATGAWAISEVLRSVLSGAGVPAAVLGGLVAAWGALSLWRRAPFETALLVMPAIVTALAIVALGQPMRPRFFFFLSGSAAVFAGRGIGALASSVSSWKASRWSVGAVGVSLALALAALSAAALPRNYATPKQDFDGAVAFLEARENAGSQVAAAGPACVPLAIYFRKTAWPCLTSVEDLDALARRSASMVVLYTLVDYVESPSLRDFLKSDCAVVRRFPGTLGGGDMVVCEPRRGRP